MIFNYITGDLFLNKEETIIYQHRSILNANGFIMNLSDEVRITPPRYFI